MKLELNSQQKNEQSTFKAFVDEEVFPHADRIDREERTPPEVIQKLPQKGYLGALLPEEWGGIGMDAIAYGLLNEEIGRGCSSLRCLLTVHSIGILRFIRLKKLLS
ncbi:MULTISPECIES: acyl-CoA dehydrogenase family protein [unclassified Microcoleus]|uniref:acyl-CoA dehydrogenase family protein n=1 Tax=unclassified Microcoleus TaxID=2642155 RepID=UPI0025ED6DF1|nr:MULTISPECIES: acyl-CoA dehydrogenase family protein [unclassified Microcoleus]